MNQTEIIQALEKLAANVPGFWEILVEEYALRHVVWSASLLLIALLVGVGAKLLYIMADKNMTGKDLVEPRQVCKTICVVAASIAIPCLVGAGLNNLGFAISPNFSMLESLLS